MRNPPLRHRRLAPLGEEVVNSFLQEGLHARIFFQSDVVELARNSRIEVPGNYLFPVSAWCYGFPCAGGRGGRGVFRVAHVG